MAIAFDAASSAGSTAEATSLTWAHTVGSGSDRHLIVGTCHATASNETVTGVTYGGVALSFIGAIANGTSNRSELWELVAPASGTANIVVTLSGARRLSAGAVSRTGVDQTTPSGSYASAATNSTTPTVNVSSATGELVQDAMATGPQTSTVDGSQTERWNVITTVGTFDRRSAGSEEAGAGTVTMGWTISAAANWATSGVPIKPSAGGGPTPQKARPDADTAAGSWTASSGSDLFAMLDETAASDADYIQSSASPASADICKISLSSVTDPAVGTGHILRYRYLKDAAAGDRIDLVVRLKQGATEIASWTHTDIGNTVVAAAQTLTSGEADAITSYSNLDVWLEAVKV